MNTDLERLTPVFRPRQVEKRPPCHAGCPNCGDIRGWIGTIAQYRKTGLSRDEAYSRAWGMITDVNPFPSVLGRVCPHPCEDHCNRGELDGPLAINAMERFLGDWAIDHRLPLARLTDEVEKESIGVVGGGPSGLSFAYQMARRGYSVTVYERHQEAGGMLRYGIPRYRLPVEILDAEIQRIEDLGVEICPNTILGNDVTLNELRVRHAAVYLAIGAQMGRGLDIPGADGAGVWRGTEYLQRASSGQPVDSGRRVAVIGGGNTAVDAARTARRTGADVTILYRRSRDEMPAISAEVDDTLEEDVRILFQVAPVRLLRDNGKLKTLVARRMRLGEPDNSGRRSPFPIPDSDFELSVDSVIEAVSQVPDWEGIDGLDTDHGWLLAGKDGVVLDRIWAGGDVLGLGIAGIAIAHGRRAAEALHGHLRGFPPAAVDERIPIGAEAIAMDSHDGKPPAQPARRAPHERLANPWMEVSAGITEEQFLEETSRCFSCGSCFGCRQCWMYCTLQCFTKLEEIGPGAYFSLSLDQCQDCGKCVEVCPCGFLEVT